MLGEDQELAKKIVSDIVKDLRGRRGFRQVWTELDEEDQHEILETWITIAEKHLKNKPK